MRLLMISSAVPCRRPEFPHDWNPLASFVRMGNDRMVSQLCPGKTASFWFGMPHARTPSHPPTLPLPPAKPGPWLPRLRRGNASSIATWPPDTSLYQWPLRLRASLDLGPESFSQSWASVSSRSQERSDLEPTSSSAYRLPSRGEMRHPFWAPSAMVRTLRTLSSLFICLCFCLFYSFVLFVLFFFGWFVGCFLFVVVVLHFYLALLAKNIFIYFIYFLFIYLLAFFLFIVLPCIDYMYIPSMFENPR